MLPIDCRQCQHLEYSDTKGFYCGVEKKDRVCKEEEIKQTGGDKNGTND